MSEIDPWALPQGGPAAASGAGIPAAPYRPAVVLSQPLNKRLPLLVLGLGVLYVAVNLVEIFALDRRIALVNTLIGGGAVTGAQGRAADGLVSAVSWAGVVVFIVVLIFIGAWKRSLNLTLGSVGARKAVFARAGYIYFRATWVISIILTFFLNAAANDDDVESPEQLVSHDHEFMLYFALRAAIGVVLIVFAFRLKKISEEAVDRLIAVTAG